MVRHVLLPALLALGACGSIQTTSGRDYLAAAPGTAATSMDRLVERAANVEPLLRFPARIGLARIQNGQFVPVPPAEADLWIAFAQTHASYGSFVPVSPLVARLTQELVPAAPARAGNPVDGIRLAAARQHLDAVFVYGVAASGKDRASPLSLLDLTIIGAYLVPSRLVEGTAIASGLLFDVRNGYPYATLTASGTEKDVVASIGSSAISSDLAGKAGLAAVKQLTLDADAAFDRLRAELPSIPPPTPAPAPTQAPSRRTRT